MAGVAQNTHYVLTLISERYRFKEPRFTHPTGPLSSAELEGHALWLGLEGTFQLC